MIDVIEGGVIRELKNRSVTGSTGDVAGARDLPFGRTPCVGLLIFFLQRSPAPIRLHENRVFVTHSWLKTKYLFCANVRDTQDCFT